MTLPILSYIRKIEYCAAYHLRRAIILPAQSQALVREPMPWQEIPIAGLAEVETTEEVENGTRLSTTKLTATLCHSFKFAIVPYAFCLSDVRGNKYILGTSESPYPKISLSSIHPDKTTERACLVLSVILTSTNGLLNVSS